MNIRNVSDRERQLCAEIEALKLYVAELEPDALRYRWLLAQHFPKDIPIAQVVWKRNSDPHGEWVNLVDGRELNNSIDAAMKEGAQ